MTLQDCHVIVRTPVYAVPANPYICQVFQPRLHSALLQASEYGATLRPRRPNSTSIELDYVTEEGLRRIRCLPGEVVLTPRDPVTESHEGVRTPPR